MTALTADRDTPMREGEEAQYDMAASKEIFAGSMVVLDTSGNAEPGTTATGKIAVGRAEEYKNNTGAAGAETIKVRAGTFRWANGETITKAHIGDTAYILDDQTVYRTATGKSPCGTIVDVDALGVWVTTKPPTSISTVGLLAANNLSDVGTVATARSNLGLDTADTPTFADLTLTDDLFVAGEAVYANKLNIDADGAYTVQTPAIDGDSTVSVVADNSVITLPNAAAGNKGMRVRVRNAAAAGAAKVSVSPHSSDYIKGTIMAVTASGVVDKDLINTKATALQGDYVDLECDGTDTWWIVGGVGIWASEA